MAVSDQYRLQGGRASPRRGRARDVATSRRGGAEAGRRRGRPAESGRGAARADGDGEAPTAGGPSVDELFARIRAGTEAAKAAEARADARPHGVAAPDADGDRGCRRGHAGRRRRTTPAGSTNRCRDPTAASSRSATRCSAPIDGAAQPDGQAGPRRRPEPAARQVAQHAVAARPTNSSVPRASISRRCRRSAQLSGQGVRRRGDVRRQPGGGARRRRGRSGGERTGPGDRRPCCAGRSRTAATSQPTGSARPTANGGANGSSAWSATSATQAFSAGVLAAGADGKVRWIVTNVSGCSDCDDNALAGAVSVDEVFPTGHAYPPAHSGCRCLVAPTDG